MKNLIVALVVLMSAGNIAFAEDAAKPAAAVAPTGNGQMLEKRVEHQHQRIKHMEEKGKISADDAAALNKKVDAVGAKVEEAKKDGVTKEERKEIRQELKASREEIKKARKNKK